MSAFDRLCTEEVRIAKSGTEVVSDVYKCTLTPKQAVIFDDGLDVDEGDSLIRILPNGKRETYTVLEVSFNSGLGGIPSHYELTLRKDASLVAERKIQHTTFNISNSQGFQIGDHNSQQFVSLLKDIVSKIDSSSAPAEEKDEAKGRLAKFIEHPLVCAVVGGAVGGLSGIITGK